MVRTRFVRIFYGGKKPVRDVIVKKLLCGQVIVNLHIDLEPVFGVEKNDFEQELTRFPYQISSLKNAWMSLF